MANAVSRRDDGPKACMEPDRSINVQFPVCGTAAGIQTLEVIDG